MGARNPLRPSPVGPWLSQLGASRNPGRDGDFRDRHDFRELGRARPSKVGPIVAAEPFRARASPSRRPDERGLVSSMELSAPKATESGTRVATLHFVAPLQSDLDELNCYMAMVNDCRQELRAIQTSPAPPQDRLYRPSRLLLPDAVSAARTCVT